jgi:hypothetical protein
MKILAVTTNFGFGPTSKLVAILDEISKIEGVTIDFLGNGRGLEYILKNTEYVHEFINLDSEMIKKSDFIHLLSSYDLLVNVMNLHVQSVTEKNGLTKQIFIDSLSWMWDKTINGIEKADFYFIQDTFKNLEKVKNLSNKRYVNPILGLPESVYEVSEKKNNIVVNVSGIFTPFESEKFGIRYLQFYLDVFQTLDLSEYENVYFACNKKQIEAVDIEGYHKFTFKEFSHIDFLSTAKTSKKIFTTPGLTFFLESNALNIEPYYLLPSNYSQVLLLEKYKKLGKKGLNLFDINPLFKISEDIEEEIAVEKVRNYLTKLWEENFVEIGEDIKDFLVTHRDNQVPKRKFENGASQIIKILSKEVFL